MPDKPTSNSAASISAVRTARESAELAAADRAPKDATSSTRAANASVRFDLDPADFERATRGLVAQHATGRVEGGLGVVWDVSRYAFISPDATVPDTVNPSLWRQAQLNAIHGLFEVAPGVWQARGYDISNITFIAGATGWIVIDPLTSPSCARDCLALANEHLGERPVTAVIYTHSHLDHYGGIFGVTSIDDVAAGRCSVIAPEGFMHEAVAENLLAGMAMGRRSLYQFGPTLPPGPKGHIDCGLGKAIPIDAPGLLAPTIDITETGQELVVDGVRVIFQLTPGTEAPAEMNFFFPEHGWLCTAEVCTHTMHNLVPIRGALVRDSLRWSFYIDEAMDMFGDNISLMFASHHWPRWGNDDVRAYLALQRDLYRWMHDQTLRWANHGETPLEIAERMELPPEFQAHGHTRGYYGDLVHNVKAVYQRYLSWYDGNPARLHPHPPSAAGARYVEFMGGADALLAKARASFEAGDYRWVTEVVNHLVFADPTNLEARALQADALEQLGYQAESSTFRNAYLTGAQELRQGTPMRRPQGRRSVASGLNAEHIFGLLSVRLRSEDVGGLHSTVRWNVTDAQEKWTVRLSNRTLSAIRTDRSSVAPNAEVSSPIATLQDLYIGDVTVTSAVETGALSVTGELSAVAVLFEHLDTFLGGFPIVEP